MPLAHAALTTLPVGSSTPDDLQNTVENWQCGQNAQLCQFVEQFTHERWILAATDLLLARPLAILVIILLALLARRITRRAINRFAQKASEGTVPQRWRWRDRAQTGVEGSAVLVNERRRQRAETMASVLRSISSAVIFTIAGVMVLDEFGIPVGPIIASAGIIGVALGFGSQTLVKDFLSGIFMLIEDQYGVGDVIDTGEAIGAVEAVTLRVTRLRDLDGAVWYVRNGEIIRIGNHSQGWARAVVDLPAPYGEDVERIQDLLKATADEMWQEETWNELILDEPEIWGVQTLAPDSMVIRLVFRTAPLEQWRVAREMNRRVKVVFDREGIEIPFPQRTIWVRNEAPPHGDHMRQTPAPATAGDGASPAAPSRPPAGREYSETAELYLETAEAPTGREPTHEPGLEPTREPRR
ncbi:MAG: mechanosensitive ion channel family protein [Actinomycetes bacterium]